jgi:hypothetical protein
MSDEQNKNDSDPHAHTRRDGETLLMLGAFIAILSLPVIAGTLFIQADEMFPKVVNMLAGTVLLVIGAALAYRGKQYLSRM